MADLWQSHTILGSKSQRGLTQMTLDVLFRSIGANIRRPHHPDLPTDTMLLSSLQASDVSEAQILSATTFLESIYGDSDRGRLSRAQTPMSRAQTPMMVGDHKSELPGSFPISPLHATSTSTRPSVVHFVPDHFTANQTSIWMCPDVPESGSSPEKEPWQPPSKLPFMTRLKNLRSPVMVTM